eukprot:3972601-Pleurochrysis_carterae.AAC.2
MVLRTGTRVRKGAGGKEETEELDGAGGVGAKVSPRHYSALTNALVRPLPALKSHRHVLRNVVHRCFSARGSLSRDFDLAAGRPAVIVRAQPLGY